MLDTQMQTRPSLQFENFIRKSTARGNLGQKHLNILTRLAIAASVYSFVNYGIKNELGLQLTVTALYICCGALENLAQCVSQLFNSSKVGRVSFLLKCIHTHASCQIGITLKGLDGGAAAERRWGQGEEGLTPLHLLLPRTKKDAPLAVGLVLSSLSID